MVTSTVMAVVPAVLLELSVRVPTTTPGELEVAREHTSGKVRRLMLFNNRRCTRESAVNPEPDIVIVEVRPAGSDVG